MKLNKLFFAFLLAITTFAVSCSKEDSIIKESSRIDAKDIMLTVEKGTETISFFAADDWTASLSASSWIKIDPMTKSGKAGESKVVIEWNDNSSVKERVADLTIAVRGENPVKIRLTQLPEEASLIVDKSTLNLIVKPEAGNGRGQFVDTISVKSNIKWSLKNIPAWIEYSTVGDAEPQEGVVSNIQLIISADPKKFDQTVMNSTFELGSAEGTDLDVAIDVTAETILKAVDKDMQPVTSLPLTISSATGLQYAASVKLISNSLWKLKEYPVWAQPSVKDNATEYASTLNTEITFWFSVDSKDLDTDALKGNVVFVNEQTNTTASFELLFPGTGEDYFDYDLIISSDTPFDPITAYDEQWNPIPGSTSMDFNMFTGRDYKHLGEAPFAVHFVNSKYGIAEQIPARWAGIEMLPDFKSTKSPLISKKLSLYVNPRQEFEENPYATRYALMIITSADVKFNDLFTADGELKREYEDVAKLFGQNGLEEPKFDSAIPEIISFASNGGEKVYEIYSGPSMIGTTLEFEHPWIEITFEKNDMDRPSGMIIKTKPNTTGKDRKEVITITEYKPSTDSEVGIYEFTVTQAAE